MKVLQEVDFSLQVRQLPPIPPSPVSSAYLNHAQLALRHIHQLDLLHRHGLARSPVEGLVDGSKRAPANAIAESLRSHKVSFHTPCRSDPSKATARPDDKESSDAKAARGHRPEGMRFPPKPKTRHQTKQPAQPPKGHRRQADERKDLHSPSTPDPAPPSPAPSHRHHHHHLEYPVDWASWLRPPLCSSRRRRRRGTRSRSPAP
jgi:hypothetical protein